MSSLSVILITKNEDHNIRDCLSTIVWAEEVIVVDGGSTDTTVSRAREFTDKVFVRPWEGYGAAKNFALAQATNDWVLWLDADERVTDQLKDEIKHVLEVDDGAVAAYSMPRRANFLGRWILHCGWYPGRVTRLFRRSSGRFTEARVHERLEIQGRTGELRSDLLHYTDPSLSHYLDKFNKYTSLASEELNEEHKQFHIGQVTVRPFWTFFKMYFLQRGFLDGIEGFTLCILSSCYVFTKYVKLWEQSHKESGRRPSHDK
jgi:glycosyltransferase involved in cell wall biosynthesis